MRNARIGLVWRAGKWKGAPGISAWHARLVDWGILTLLICHKELFTPAQGRCGAQLQFQFFLWIISCRCYKHLPGQRSCCQEGVVGEVDFVEQLLLPTFSVAWSHWANTISATQALHKGHCQSLSDTSWFIWKHSSQNFPKVEFSPHVPQCPIAVSPAFRWEDSWPGKSISEIIQCTDPMKHQ